MPSRSEQHTRFVRIDAAFKTGDLAALAAAAGPDDRFPDAFSDLAIGACLPYAVYHGPIALIAALLNAGADPNFDEGDGFPPLIAAVSKLAPAPGSTPRDDIHEVLALLLARGADPGQRGINDYTALHWAAGIGDLRAVEILLAAGADPDARTRIDDLETAEDAARRGGHAAVADRIAAASRARTIVTEETDR